MSIQGSTNEKSLRSKFLLPVLFLSMFLVFSFEYFLSNDLVNVASSLKVTVGTASQILTIGLFSGLLVGFAMSFLTVKIKFKSLFLFGVTIYGLGVLGCYFAPNFASLLFFSFFPGIGSAMIGIMVFVLIGDYLPLEKKGLVVSLAISGGLIANIVMPQVTSLITIAAGWRAVLLWFIFPIFVVSLLFSFFVLPSKPHQEQNTIVLQYWKAFKQVLQNKSALSCAVGTALVSISTLVPIYAVSFYRLFFREPLNIAGIFFSVSAGMAFLGVIIGGRLINQIGRKPLTVVTGVIQGIFAILIAFAPNVWVSVAFWWSSAVFAGVAVTALFSLVLEQVPSFRGTMMSLNQSFQSFGAIIGLTISGLVLNLYANNFQIIYSIFGISGIASAAVVFALTKDTVKPRSMS